MQQSPYPDEMSDSVEEALSNLYQRYAPGILTHIGSHTPSREDAEDLLVDTFLAAYESPSFHALTELQQRLWLWRVARNKVADYYRTSSRQRTLSIDDMADEISCGKELEPEYLATRGEEYLQLREQVKKLSALQQQVLELRFVDNLRCVDIARQLGKSDVAVRMLLSRTLTLLRSIYTKR